MELQFQKTYQRKNAFAVGYAGRLLALGYLQQVHNEWRFFVESPAVLTASELMQIGNKLVAWNTPVKQEKQFTAPLEGYYKCSACGEQHPIDDDKSYEEQAACLNDDCFGQRFCIKWDGWKKPPIHIPV